MPMVFIGLIVVYVLFLALLAIFGKLIWIGIAVFLVWLGWSWFKKTPTYKKYS